MNSLFFENKEARQDDKQETYQIIPAEVFFEIEDGEERKNSQGDDFLDGFKLGGSQFPVAQTVGRHLKTVF